MSRSVNTETLNHRFFSQCTMRALDIGVGAEKIMVLSFTDIQNGESEEEVRSNIYRPDVYVQCI